MGRKCGCGRRQRPTPTLPLPLAQPEPHILCTPTPKVYFTEKTKNKKRVNQTTSLSLGLREKQSMEESQSVRGRVCVYQGGLGEPSDEWTERFLLTECTWLLLRCPEEYSHLEFAKCVHGRQNHIPSLLCGCMHWSPGLSQERTATEAITVNIVKWGDNPTLYG